ncbi:MAG: DUF488 domain-containing protein [Pseudorhodoplanes sp.]
MARKSKVTKFKVKKSEAEKSGARKAPPLFTIGYEQSRPDAVLAALKEARVELLIDTRAVAASRKPGFSKRQLSASLDEIGIRYLHLQKLGTPAEGREAARAGDMKTLWRIYNRHLKTHDAVEAMDELLSLIGSGQRVCLLCFERDPGHCHRSRIAEIVTERTGAKVSDLVPAI